MRLRKPGKCVRRRIKIVLKILGNKRLQQCEITEKTDLTKREVQNTLTKLKRRYGVLNHDISTGEWWINKKALKEYRNTLS